MARAHPSTPSKGMQVTEYVTSTSNKFFPRVRGTLEQRFWSKVVPDPNSGCWLWAGDTNGRYGSMSIRWPGHQTRVFAHRFSYELHNRVTIPPGLEVDHKCRTTFCVNPAHLQLVTPQVNNALRPPQKRKPFLVCKKGHTITSDNTIIVKRHITGKPYAICKLCRGAADLRTQARRRSQ